MGRLSNAQSRAAGTALFPCLRVVNCVSGKITIGLNYVHGCNRYNCDRLTDICNKVGLEDPDDAERYILHMVEAGEICAKIAFPAGTVHFQEDSHTFSSAAMTLRLEADLQSTAELTERVRSLEERLMTNPVFVQKARSLLRAKSSYFPIGQPRIETLGLEGKWNLHL